MDIKFLARKGVSEALTLLGEDEDNSVLGRELKEKTGITSNKLKILVDEGVLERSDERVLVRTIPIRRRISTYNISDKGKRLLEICESIDSILVSLFLSPLCNTPFSYLSPLLLMRLGL